MQTLDNTMPLHGDLGALRTHYAHSYAHAQSDYEAAWRQQRKRASYLLTKRILDVLLSACALVVLSPVFLIVAILIQCDSKGPVVFVHKRVGQNGKPLNLYKFRSMVADAQERMQRFSPEQKEEFERNYKLDHDPRITKIGTFLRKSSLDELPQLLNILKGELSIVGPRPLVLDELEKYGVNKRRFLSVKPGLTGYWQVNGRSATSYDKRIALELFYVEHASIPLDLLIMFKTFVTVFSRNGAV